MFEEVNPRQVILVTTRAKIEIMGKLQEKENVFTLSWHSPLSFNPRLYGIAVAKNRFSYKMIKHSGVFCINFISYKYSKDALYCGRNSGEHIDKFANITLTKEDCKTIDCLRFKEAEAYLECEVTEEVDAGDHVFFIAKVLKSESTTNERRLLYKGADLFTTTLD